MKDKVFTTGSECNIRFGATNKYSALQYQQYRRNINKHFWTSHHNISLHAKF